jgi:hypothetical protein
MQSSASALRIDCSTNPAIKTKANMTDASIALRSRMPTLLGSIERKEMRLSA